MPNCRTPGCEPPPPSPLAAGGARFCERCGWPLAEGRVRVEPDRVQLLTGRPGEVRLVLEASGEGAVEWALDPSRLPAGVEPLDECERAEAGRPQVVKLQLDPDRLSDGPLVFPVRLADRRGEHAGDLRPSEGEAVWREEEARVLVSRQRHGPLSATALALPMFYKATQAVFFQNRGESRLEVVAEVSPGYRLSLDGRVWEARRGFALEGGQSQGLSVRPEPEAGDLPEGRLTGRAQGLDPLSVGLVPVRLPKEPPPRGWLVAIDFGTSKSAAMLLDRGYRGAEPAPVTWDRPSSPEPAPWVPTVVQVGEDGAPRKFGWAIPSSEAGASVHRSLKVRLLEEDPVIRRCVVFFLQELLHRIDEQRPGILAAPDTRLVLTLPVLDQGQRLARQRALTLELLLEAGRRWGLGAERVDFFLEPECAAVDFLGQLEGRLKERQWLCVLDMGGGTTDVTFAELAVGEGGKLEFTQLKSFGYERLAGDRVDERLYGWVLEQWIQRKRLERGEVKDYLERPSIRPKGEPIDYVRSSNLAQLLALKESMYSVDPPKAEVWDEFTARENRVALEPAGLEPPLESISHAILHEGVGEGAPPLGKAFRELLGLRPADVRVLCLTGGTSRIRRFADRIRQEVLSGNEMEILQDRSESVRLNVVRGAAQRAGLRIPGTLAWEVQVARSGGEAPSPEGWVTLLPAGAVPGAKKSSAPWWLERGERAAIWLRLLLPGQPPLDLWRCEVTHDLEDEGDNLECQLSYAKGGQLSARLWWRSAACPPDPFPMAPVAHLPVR